jgi:hypothetical protein
MTMIFIAGFISVLSPEIKVEIKIGILPDRRA